MTTATATATVSLPRVLGHLPGPTEGPLLIAIGGMHGNEPAGVRALRRVLGALAPRRQQLRGTLLALSGNRPALGRGVRYIEQDLNRIWRRPRLEALRAGAAAASCDEEEMCALDLELRAAIDSAGDGHVIVLDLHTTSADNPVFSVLNDTLPNRALAAALPVPTVLGLEEELSGTLLNYLSRVRNIQSLGFESGQHDDPQAVDLAVAAIWLALAESGVIHGDQEWPEVAAARRALEHAASGLPRFVDVLARHPIEPADGFRMCPGFCGFQPVRKGDVLADDIHGPVQAPCEGMLLMPLYQGQGDDGFFIVRPVRPIWLRLSAALRRSGLVRRMHWLPGIHRHPTLPDSLVVDRRVARVLAVELFHLLGFSRRGPVDGRYVTMRRRALDRPFDARSESNG